MPQIIPIKDLKNTANISKICAENKEPIFITKNGYGDMVIMSIKTYEHTMAQIKEAELVNEAIKDIENANLSSNKGTITINTNNKDL